MRTFTIPGPPADLKAVRDGWGYVWIRDGESDRFTHHFPDAEAPAMRTWWELIGESALTECQPEIQNYYL